MIRQYTQKFQTRLHPIARGSLFYFGFFGAMGMFLPFLTVYFRQDLGFSGRQIGILSIVQPLMMLLVAIPVASLADHRRWRVPLLQVTIL
jgi:PPP family 3-phenylpropionic acid transporter